MARAIELIEKDIVTLQAAIRAIAAELQNAYDSYLTTLGQALRKQLILATYHLCTQGYPENFLRLSLNQRQKLQQAIRNSGQEAAELLLSYLQSQAESEDEVEQNKEVHQDEQVEPEEEVDQQDEAESEDEVVTYILSDSSALPLINSVLKSFAPDLSNPVELAKWQQNLENFIQQVLKNVSRDANLLLQKASILPSKLPEPILEAAAAVSEASAEVIPGPANLLNVVVEITNEEDPEESRLTQIMAINLRLGEIEFADTTLSSARRQIRHVLVELNKLGRDYQKKQRERSIAEAESAWRASWFE
ncbi:hypothetical protein VB620_16255 [Nodularia harveyana UHCC-0300]|uniref:Uncharacterized protein n=1 Tax=Nodularia harveyana UHCC-0300 TaxID=2974287 RepID=A0ABU5UHD3_9CYAN|nr:hypothetical protein [Nodularia harveyana]MEA5582889.1 hypothetical protein [Nodularia harveyana UHCC-0300]